MEDRFDTAKAEAAGKSDDVEFNLLFVGSLFPPNQQGVTWFVDNVMPYVNASFTIVGKGFEKLKGVLDRKNVQVVGRVEHTDMYYYLADAVVGPILSGAGMKVKTAEALMYGKTLFATDEALEGYDVQDTQSVYRCNDTRQFIQAINSYAEKNHREKYDKQLRGLFIEKYNTERYIQPVKELITKKYRNLRT